MTVAMPAATPFVRRLPSTDWIAIAVGLASLALQGWLGWAWAVTLVAITLPSVLRELGILKDGDEFLRGVAHRAAFHSMAFVVCLILLNRVLHTPDGTDGFPLAGSLRLAEGVFLVSYLLQYWGAREGAFRVLIGAAAMMVVGLIEFLRPVMAEVRVPAMASISVTASVVVGLALIVRRWPRLAAWILTTISVLGVGFLAWFYLSATPYASSLAFVGTGSVVFLLFGCTGLALWRELRSA